MFCPKCEQEWRWDVMVCPTCDVETVDRLPGPEPTPDAQLVVVLATGDAGLSAVARSLLDAEKIDYIVRGDGLQDLFGYGRLTSYSFLVGPAEFLVRSEDADRARELLSDLSAGDPKPNPTEDG